MKRKREPKACEHQLTYTCDTDFLIKCAGCHAVVNKPEPPKPELAAREFSLYKFADGEIRAFPSNQATVVYAGFTPPIFICATREILPGEER